MYNKFTKNKNTAFFKPYTKTVHSPACVRNSAFTIAEVMASLVVLGMITISSFKVITRCQDSSIDMRMKGLAFQVAGENLDKILSDQPIIEFESSGESELYPEISWEAKVDTKDEPLTRKVWVRAVSKAMYLDSDNEEQQVELVYYITDLSAAQSKKHKEFMDKFALLQNEFEDLSDIQNPDTESNTDDLSNDETEDKPKTPMDELIERANNPMTQEEFNQWVKELMDLLK